MDYLLAYDVGTSGCKAVLVTPGGEIVAKAYEPYPTYYPRPLWAEQDVEDWWRAVCVTTQRLLQASGARAQEILALSFSSQMLNTIALDKEGRLLRPSINWLDGRAWEEAGKVMRKLGGERIFALIVGAGITGKDLIPKYLWLKSNEPGVYRDAAALLDAGGYLLYRTTGKLACEWSVASVTGLFNLKSKTWDTTLMRFVGLHPEKYPELVRSIDQVGGLTTQAASDLGLVAGTPVFGGAGDAQNTVIGSGASAEGDAHLALGTSGYVAVITEKRLTGRRGVATIQSADPGKLLLIAEAETVGECLRWAAKALYGQEPEAAVFSRMDAEVAGTVPGADSLLFTPWLYGERCPIPDESLRAAFINLGANHSRAQMTRAIYEGVAYNIRWILELMEEMYHFPCDPLRVIGGGARGLPWMQIIADVTGRKLEGVANPREASALGAALVAAVGLGMYPSIEATKALVNVEQVMTPVAEHQQVYQPLYKAYQQIYKSLRRLYHGLNRQEKQAVQEQAQKQ